MSIVRASVVAVVLALAWSSAAQEAGPEAVNAGAAPETDATLRLEPASEAARPPAGPAGALASALSYPGLGQLAVGSEMKAAAVGATQAFLVAQLVLEDRWTRHALRLYNETGRESHYDRRQTLVWWVVAVGLLSLADAYVDAHLVGFDAPAPPALLDAEEGPSPGSGGGLRLGLGIGF